MGIAALVLFGLVAVMLFVAFWAFMESSPVGIFVSLLVAAALLISAVYLQTHRSVQSQYVGVSKNSITQELQGPYKSGLIPKPFFGTVYQFPASSRYERCEVYTPAIKGSYGITADICFYVGANQVDWVKEISRTGSFDSGIIMNVWRNSVTDEVAKVFKDYTPEQLSNNRMDVKVNIMENVKPWFDARGIPLVDVVFKNWDFSSVEVASAFDQSIISQRKITEQSALLEAAKISREREIYEVETTKLVADEQSKAIDTLGIPDEDIIEWLWIAAMTEAGKMPDTFILGTAPIAVPAK